MAQTVIGIFDDASEAQTAMQELVEAGFLQTDIDLSTQTSDTTNTSAEYDTDNDRDKKGGIMGFFASLFDTDDDRDRYTTVGERHSILTVHAQSEEDAERAADILDDAGAIDVNERADQYRSGTYAGASIMGSGMTTGVPADPLAPIYGESPHVVSDEGQNKDQTMGRRVDRQRSRIVDRPLDETYRLREGRGPVDPESDVTKR